MLFKDMSIELIVVLSGSTFLTNCDKLSTQRYIFTIIAVLIGASTRCHADESTDGLEPVGGIAS